jgi:hypothetical protein
VTSKIKVPMGLSGLEVSKEQSWIDAYWDIPGRREIDIPYGWAQDEQHLLMGPIMEIYAYLKSVGCDFYFDIAKKTMNQIVLLDDSMEVLMAERFIWDGRLNAAEKITLHLLPSYKTLFNSYIGKDVFPSLMASVVTTHLEAGVEIDIATGSPAILEAKISNFYSHMDMLKDVWEVSVSGRQEPLDGQMLYL